MLVKPAPLPPALAALLGDKAPRFLGIRDPFTKQLMPEEGRDVPADDLHWARLLRDGDIVPVAPAKASSKRSAEQ